MEEVEEGHKKLQNGVTDDADGGSKLQEKLEAEKKERENVEKRLREEKEELEWRLQSAQSQTVTLKSSVVVLKEENEDLRVQLKLKEAEFIRLLNIEASEHKHEVSELQQRIEYLERELEASAAQHSETMRELQEHIHTLEKQPALEARELHERIAYLEEKLEQQEKQLRRTQEVPEIKLRQDDDEEFKLRFTISEKENEIKRLSHCILDLESELSKLQQVVEMSGKEQRSLSDSMKRRRRYSGWFASQKDTDKKKVLPRVASEDSLLYREKKKRPLRRQSLVNFQPVESDDDNDYESIYADPVELSEDSNSLPPPPPPLVSCNMNFKWETTAQNSPKMIRGATVLDEVNSCCYFGSSVSHTIHQYDIKDESWSRLPDCPHLSFSLALVNDCLTAVGGEKGRGPTNELISYISGGDEKWVHVFPPMHTRRSNGAAVTSGRLLIVAGGDGGRGSDQGTFVLDTVEILDIDEKVWSMSLARLPKPVHSVSISLCPTTNTLYLMGGRESEGKPMTSVYTCSVNTLSQSCSSKEMSSQLHRPPEVWKALRELPIAYPTGCVVQGQLIAIGGIGENESSKNIYLFDVLARRWKLTGVLPRGRERSLVANLPRGRIMVVGGCSKVNMIDVVEIATVTVESIH